MMNTHADKSQKPESKSIATPKKQKNGPATFQLMDKRSEAVTLRRLQNMANESNQVSQLRSLQEKTHQGFLEEKNPIQKKPNNTGLPNNLKTGIENLSGYSMDDVKVHYNSAKPAQLNAHAYAQGTNIHLASGQEKHLPHEAWHVVQQKQGRVQPTMQMKGGANVNDDVSLEKEADVMGGKAINNKQNLFLNKIETKNYNKKIVQRVVNVINESEPNVLWNHVRGLVENRYRRKKTLLEWSARPKDYLNFDSYESLAKSLDMANQSKASKGRQRPNWTPKIKNYYDRTWGGKRHRRHIIMSSLMRDTVYAVTDNQENKRENVLNIYNEIIATAGFSGYDKTSIEKTESALVYVLHNNPANLVLDSGAENSAIGSLAHNFNKLLEMDDKDLAIEFKIFSKDSPSYLLKIVGGFQTEVQKKIISEVASQFPLPTDVSQFREFLELIYDNTAVDVMTKESLPPQAVEMLSLHGRFVAAQSKADLQILYGAAMTYVMEGVKFKFPYSNIW